jgi:hypothetical protein
MTHMAVMVNLRAGIAPMDRQVWIVTASPTVHQEYQGVMIRPQGHNHGNDHPTKFVRR